jgi:hypothetical protein
MKATRTPIALLFGLLLMPCARAADDQDAITNIVQRWVGDYDNNRQVAQNIERGPPAAPELTRERRSMSVRRIDAPQFGNTVLFFEESRETEPGLAHRQRVVTLIAEPNSARVRAEQWFFNSGPTYDRKPLDPAVVARLPRSDFRRVPECDLYFVYEAALDRYRGAMQPRKCEYDHVVDGRVYAEFEMLLYPDQLWYRDRSLRVRDGSIRGEIDGFSWLLFDRKPVSRNTPAILSQQGVWRGIFRRYDADGVLTAEFPSEIVVRVQEDGATLRYRQTNIYRPAGAPQQRIESSGEVRDGRVWFSNDRLDGWSMDIPGDPTGRGAVLVMNYKDGSQQYVYEIITRSADGTRRSRATQYFQAGRLLRRTLIDEEKVTSDWRAWDAAQSVQP